MRVAHIPLTERQTHTLNLFLDGYEAKITSKKWADLNNCSKDTAIRDIQDLQNKGILREDIPGAKRPSYSILYGDDSIDLMSQFKDVKIEEDSSDSYLVANYHGTVPVKERILKLDAERYQKGELSLDHLLSKYCAYMIKRD